ncbi:MAG: DUF4038 domain-containing protein [Spirochaetes bacterium]|nr:DUF4038 domain-containing protein [Spirochaetota bacterium]
MSGNCRTDNSWAGGLNVPVRIVVLAGAILFGGISVSAAWDGPSVDFSHGQIQVSGNGHFLQHTDGTPFVWIGDTGWRAITRLNRQDMETYLENRRQKGFTIIQVMIYDFEFPHDPNTYGDYAFSGSDATQPVTTIGNNPNDPAEYDFWDHVDYFIDLAYQKGLYVGIFPVWGNTTSPRYGGYLDTTAEATDYGTWIANRYKNKHNIIWILGGDIAGSENNSQAHALGNAINSTDPNHIITFHCNIKHSSSEWFHSTSWLDMNMFQSGHLNTPEEMYSTNVWQQSVARFPITQPGVDWARSPAKPVVDGEPRYEDHPINWNAANGYYTDRDFREAAYWSIFAGGCGVTYGNHAVWQMITNLDQGWHDPLYTWQVGLDRPGASNVVHIRKLLLSRPYFARVPDQNIIASTIGWSHNHIQATRASDGSYAFIYIPVVSKNVSIKLNQLTGTAVQSWWYNPRDGSCINSGQITNSGQNQDFTSPSISGPDWVLVLDDASKGFPPPGTITTPPVASITSPTNGAFFSAATNITIDASASDSDGTVAKVEFYQGTNKLGEDTTAPYSYTWNSVAAGNYSLTVKAYDNGGASTISSAVVITVSTSGMQNIALGKATTVSSVENTSRIGSNAVDGNGTTRWASEHSDPQWISIDLGQVYTISQVILKWETAYGKSYQIQVSGDASSWTNIYSTTNGNGGTNILSVSGTGRYIRMYGTQRAASYYGYSLWEFEVFGSGAVNNPPSASITSPSNGAFFSAGTNINISASASDSDGTVVKVEFYQGTNKLGEDTISPYSYTWNSVAAGNYSLTAKAYDSGGASTISSAVVITVSTSGMQNIAQGKATTVSSVENTSRIGSNAVDGNGTTRWASEHSDPQWISIDLGQVYTISQVILKWETAYGKSYQVQVSGDASSWTNIYSTTNGNGGTNILSVSGTGRYIRMYGTQRAASYYGYSLWEFEVFGSGAVNNPPSASITSPSNGAFFSATTNITIAASASDSDGTVAKVEFYQGTNKLGEDTTAPYSYIWNSVAAGNYSLTAKVFDNGGAVNTSAAVTISVGSPPVTLQAESYSSMSGVINNGTSISGCDTGNWVCFNNVDFGGGCNTFIAAIGVPASYAGKQVEIRLGSATGTLLGTLTVASTGAWETYVEQSIPITTISGVQTVYFVFNGGYGVGNFDYFRFPIESAGTAAQYAVQSGNISIDPLTKKINIAYAVGVTPSVVASGNGVTSNGTVNLSIFRVPSDNSIQFAYAPTGTGNWTSIEKFALEGSTSTPDSGIRRITWNLPLTIDFSRHYDVLISGTWNGAPLVPYIVADIDLAPSMRARTSLDGFCAFGSPYRGNGMITFANLTTDAAVTIFSVSGKKVAHLAVSQRNESGMLQWNVMTENGKKIAPGAYFCRASSATGVKIIRVLVLR